jgi:type II secretory pathway pseudopilin PulG
MRRLLKWWPRDRRQAQAGTTLVELLVSLMIVGLALVLIVGTFSTALLNASLAKRNTAVQAVMQYELERVGAAQFSSSAPSYSECFSTESPTSPKVLPSYLADCPDGTYSFRADVTWTAGPSATSQLWTITVGTWPDKAPVGSPLSTYKAEHK